MDNRQFCILTDDGMIAISSDPLNRTVQLKDETKITLAIPTAEPKPPDQQTNEVFANLDVGARKIPVKNIDRSVYPYCNER